MANRTRIKVTGLKELQRALQKLPDDLQAPAVKGALKESLEPMRDMAVDLAPFDEGQLEENIIISDSAEDPVPERMDQITVYVGADVEKPGFAPHAHLVEYGTGPRYHESGKYVGEMPAQPYMRPAFDAKAKGVITEFGRFLGRYIEAAAKIASQRTRR